jgi:transposase InsO family protein
MVRLMPPAPHPPPADPPERPRANATAERFIQTMLRDGDYAAADPNSAARRRALLPWLHDSNDTRPHGSLGRTAPITQLKPEQPG